MRLIDNVGESRALITNNLKFYTRRYDDQDHVDDRPLKFGIMFIILFVSLFASSFPTLSKRVSYLKIPRIVFFTGKHFGTGVILSTAFVHLLQDSFETLLDPGLNTPLRHWIGLVVLGSLLSIFFVEYASMTYVERMEDAEKNHNHTHHHKHSPISPTIKAPTRSSPQHSESPSLSPSQINLPQPQQNTGPEVNLDCERTALLTRSTRARSRSFAYGAAPTLSPAHEGDEAAPFFSGHHRYEPPCSHPLHHTRGSRAVGFGNGAVTLFDPQAGDSSSSDRDVRGEQNSDDGEEHEQAGKGERPASKRRQVVSILVLQMGIMLHSLVIGLTLSITSGPEFTSLVTAILFHQLFEGLSLGIRISSLPHSDGKGGVLSVLKPTLAVLFAVTTPVGILLGLLALPRGGGSETQLQMKLTQGIMSAISAGMLIYATCVEMLAADFVMDPQTKQSSFRMQALAFISLLMGAGGMSIIG